MRKCVWFLFTLFYILCSCAKDKGPIAPPVKQPVATGPYFSQVKKIVQNNCTITCHAPSHGFMDGLPVVLESDSDIVSRGPSIKDAISGPFTMFNKQMPPAGGLSESDIEIVTQWLAKGGQVGNCGTNQRP